MTYIASRTFLDRDSKPFVVRLGAPEADGDDWMCRVEFEDGGSLSHDEAFGIDALQALVNATQLVRRRVLSLNEARGFTFLGGDSLHLPRVIAHGFGKAFDDGLNAAIDTQLEGALEAAKLARQKPTT